MTHSISFDNNQQENSFYCDMNSRITSINIDNTSVDSNDYDTTDNQTSDNDTCDGTNTSSSSSFISSDNYDDYFDDLTEFTVSANGYDPLYENCGYTVRDFAIAYTYTCQYMKINRQSRDIILGLFRSFLQINNNLPSTYSMLVKTLNYMPHYIRKNR